VSILTDRTRGNARCNGVDSDSPAASGCYEREDRTLFRTVSGISQMSGVPPGRLRRLIAKELADNGLDTGGDCRVGELPGGGFFVEDDGPGIPGAPEEIARLFSFGRPFVSSKLKRLPTRGAMGNGLRILAGAVFTSNGTLRVITRGRVLDLKPQMTGETLVEWQPCEDTTGTGIEVHLGEAIPEDSDSLRWAETAIRASGNKPIYTGKTSPWWNDSDSFFELLQAAGRRNVSDVMQDFDGYTDVAGVIVGERFDGRTAASLTLEEAEQLLRLARQFCNAVGPERLVLLNKGLSGSHAKTLGTLHLKPGRGSLDAELPHTVEAWCRPSQGPKDYVTVLVNRTPVTGDVWTERGAKSANLGIFGCNFGYEFTVGRKPISLTVNVQIPYMPITSNGKEPDLDHFVEDLCQVIENAAKKCQAANRPEPENRADGFLPSKKRGRPNAEDNLSYKKDLRRFADRLKEINSTFDFPVSSRGWCYILENAGHITKGDFDKAQGLINDCRKSGLLPIHFTSDDESRAADHLEHLDGRTPEEYAADLARGLLRAGEDYEPVSFWEFQPVYVQMVVEKVDLKHLFGPICKEYHVPLINARGWSDLNLRARLMRRFKEHEEQGRQPVLLYCGDFDPKGLQMSDNLPRLLKELEPADGVDWCPDNLTVDRFGLNKDFIEAQGLSWIDGLETGSGKDLADPRHRDHRAPYVQRYIEEFGKRKVEANALVVWPEAGRQLCRDAIERYLDLSAVAVYKRRLSQQRLQVRRAVPGAVEKILALLAKASPKRRGS
jgi:hypothetical protein